MGSFSVGNAGCAWKVRVRRVMTGALQSGHLVPASAPTSGSTRLALLTGNSFGTRTRERARGSRYETTRHGRWLPGIRSQGTGKAASY